MKKSRITKAGVGLLVGLALGCLLACAPSNLRPLSELQTLTTQDVEYTIQAGDTLMVNVWGEARLSGPVVVREDGRFSMPLIEDVQAEGKTVKKLTEEVSARLVAFIPAASVAISLSQPAPIRYYLSGQFIKPGEFRSERKISLLQAIATGGSFAPFADESEIILIRKSQNGDLRYRFDYNRVVEGLEPNPELKNGDLITVK